MQAPAEATEAQEAEAEGLVLSRKVREAPEESHDLESFGYAYGRRRRSPYSGMMPPKKGRVEALDVSPHDAPHG